MIADLSMEQILFVGGVLVLAYTLKGASSFGPSLVAVPLLTYIWPHPALFLPSLALLNLSGNILLLKRFFTKVHWRSVLWLSMGTAMGIPVGVYFLKTLSGELLQGWVAIGILCTLPIVMGRKFKVPTEGPLYALGAGIIAGISGGSIGIDGPPYVIYLASRFGSDQETRYATTIATFCLGCTLRVGAFWAADLLGGDEILGTMMGIPCLIGGLLLGIGLFKRLAGPGFDRLVLLLLVATSTSLLYRTIGL